ncbi:MAG: hypothetical protein KGJ23_04520 [Euryarchaeota archaeon]|nr:hypothetical protein [Euryarchaeota archaeon]MDE1835863.1 hypothetical protein [Euryarchaeota archaeon]MDE1882207.1 hypothetical protein [Euryarchaeota archaeon]MDE2044459.1 hypothetical protein [Thermoplasmata archaeon]
MRILLYDPVPLPFGLAGEPPGTDVAPHPSAHAGEAPSQFSPEMLPPGGGSGFLSPGHGEELPLDAILQ